MCNTKVSQYRMSRLEHYIGGLHIAVDYPLLMSIGQGISNLTCDLDSVFNGKLFLFRYPG